MSSIPAPALDLSDENVRIGGAATRTVALGFALGVAGLVSATFLGERQGDHFRGFYFSYLHNYTCILAIALGSLFFVILHHITHAGWSTSIRRIAEAISTSLLALAIMFIPILVGMHELYHWTHPEAVANDPILQGKVAYLNTPFFVFRFVIYFTIWIGLSQFFHRTSVLQDKTGDVALSLRMQKVAPMALILFALSTTFAGFDLLMSLDPHWFSTIFGVYFFAGGIMSFFATMLVTVYFIQRSGRLEEFITLEHWHDLGKLMFAFTCFWAYIAFSQYMLIWYADLPEETLWWQSRHQGAWGVAGVCFLVFGHFIAPFVLIMSRNVKRLKLAMCLAALWMLAMHWFDHFWLVMPIYSSEVIPTSTMDFALLIGIGGFFVAWVAKMLNANAAIPVKDPRLAESVAFENY